MADADDDGYLQGRKRARDSFFVERPEVFQGATAARENQQITFPTLIRELERAGDLFGGRITLHRRRIDQHGGRRESPRKDREYVADRRAAG